MKFILTKELGRLAKWLRILGYDACYFKEDNKGLLLIEALRDERIILTRNSRLPQAKGIPMIKIKSDYLKEQIKQVWKDLKLKADEALMFSRCIICNVQLVEIEKEKIKDEVPEYVYNTQKDFITCPKCQRIYWAGTHWGNVTKTLKEIEVSV
jgi:hypothetical protein